VADRLSRLAVPRNLRVADPNAKTTAGVASRVERQLIRTARLNLLLIGTEQQTNAVLSELQSDFLDPITTWSSGQFLELPADARTGTFILDGITGLGLDDQYRLNDWLGSTDGRTQVVSMTPRAVVPLIETGAFLDMLYYRLNVICLDMTDGG
jgi:hypothetical protein